MAENKWAEFQGDERDYEIENLGRPKVFLLPSHKLRTRLPDGSTVEESLRCFLIENFGAFTTTTVPYFGFWRDDGAQIVYDECRLYEVSFVGKERIPLMLSKLAAVAEAIGEDCIYCKAGQYACLVRPKQRR